VSILPPNLTTVLRAAEQRLYRAARHRSAQDLAEMPTVGWSTDLLQAFDYCALVSFRRSRVAVPTPVWFGLSGDRLYRRSAASDGKLKRIRHTPEVLVAPCDLLGRPLGDPMEGLARILGDEEAAQAEEAIRGRYGTARRIYGATRAPALDPVYVEVTRRLTDDGGKNRPCAGCDSVAPWHGT
jgi:PPOX class probable F420-dependent enzyme